MRHHTVIGGWRACVPVLALLVPACSSGPAAGAGPPEMPPVPVTVTTLEATEIQEATEYVGSLKSLRSTAIQAQVDGRITAIPVRSGDRVRAGDVLVQLDPGQQAAAVASLDADRAAQEAAADLARREAARMRELHEAALVSQQARDQAEAALEAAESNLASLRARADEERVRLRYFTVSAPVDGTVGDVPVRVGMQITSSTLLTTIDDNSALELYVPVPVERATALAPGMPLEVLDARGQPLVQTTASFISPRVDELTQSVLVKGVIRAGDASLRSDQQVRVRVVWQTRQGLTVPVLSVVRLNNQYFVFLVEERDGTMTARQHPIRVGAIEGDDYIVLEGLEPGVRLVTSGVQKIADGAPIAPQS